ncbi:lactate dehydrogenase [Comamonas aquatica]|uniref:class I SAM-dependent DNA methyltransferase n=1 Tax=Comamonas aquatica TaxID=225991 RepID=UPI0024478F33|nr:DNA methyltransferase [Comamonas aquatica]MDH0373367.1 lactate dehydrogenase [Comamonas aquatica]
MNAVEIEAAVSDLATEPFNAQEFPYAFLAAFGNKDTALKRLRTGNNNASDYPGGVLLRNNIHIAVCDEGKVSETLTALLASPSTIKAKAKFVLATDGKDFEAKDLISDELVACAFEDFPNHFGLFLPLAGISTVKEIKDNPIDVRATGRLNKLYVELLRENPDWAKADRRADMNHFMARLIFCFFAEDTGIFNTSGLFSRTIEQMSDRDGSNTHEVLEVVFKAMNIKFKDRDATQPRLPNWATAFPYVNGGLFSGSTEVPRFTRIARTYLSHAANLNWKEINPDIFGSMIQAVADDEERGALGMHYTSVPNILKVLNPLFLDDLRAQLEAAGDNKAKLLNLRKRMARIRVFDPACGSGNFLVIAYKQMREIEAEINRRRGETHLRSEIPLTNFRGIELRDFPAQIARLALIIAEFQCDVLYRGQQDALAEFLPLNTENWIISGNALRLDWLSICPPAGTGVKVVSDDLFNTPLDQTEIAFENEGGETYICGNPPYIGSTWQSDEQKDDLRAIFEHRCKNWKSLDYVAGWFIKASDYGKHTEVVAAFVSTNSICQGSQVPILWPMIFSSRQQIAFAHTSFKWANLASHNAGVTVVIVGISNKSGAPRRLFSLADDGSTLEKQVNFINAYLVNGLDVIVSPISKQNDGRGLMEWGNKPTDGGHLFLTSGERERLLIDSPEADLYVKRFIGAQEFIRGEQRYCLWIQDEQRDDAEAIPEVKRRIEAVAKMRAESKAAETRPAAAFPHRFRQIQSVAKKYSLVVARVSSEERPYLPVGLEGGNVIIGDRNFALYDAPLWNMAIIASRLHWVWIGAVCVRLEMRFSYSNTLGWNTFPIPTLTEQNKTDLTACAEAILLAREAHFPATIADLYDPETMPKNLRMAHERNDEVLERIYIGRRFKNDTERLEKLFDMYTKMTASAGSAKKGKKK